MSDSDRKRGTRPAARQHVNCFARPERDDHTPNGPCYFETHRDENGEAVAWVLRDERAVARRWIVSTVGVELEDMQ